MSELVVIGFDNEHAAFELHAKLAKLQKEYLIEMEDTVRRLSQNSPDGDLKIC